MFGTHHAHRGPRLKCLAQLDPYRDRPVPVFLPLFLHRPLHLLLSSNVYNTLLMINFDEHGGTYDHVPPPAAPPPDPSSPAGQYGFTFNRSGIRVPAIAISPWIPAHTIINHDHRHTNRLTPVLTKELTHGYW